jgi:hypothetical protein
VETCTLNQDVTCVGSPNELWEPQKQLPNTVVCGSKNEIANDPNLDKAKTSVFQYQGGTYYIKTVIACLFRRSLRFIGLGSNHSDVY